MTELEVLRDVCERLEGAAIPYMLTGSMAMNYYAEPRMTRDIDMVVAIEPSDVARIEAAFRSDYYVPEEGLAQVIRDRGMFNLVHFASSVKVDMVVRKDEPFRLGEFARRRMVNLPGFSAWVVSKEDLVLSKLVWARDAESELQRRDVRNLLASGADVPYLREWAPRLGVSELLEEMLNERHQP